MDENAQKITIENTWSGNTALMVEATNTINSQTYTTNETFYIDVCECYSVVFNQESKKTGITLYVKITLVARQKYATTHSQNPTRLDFMNESQSVFARNWRKTPSVILP